MDNMKEMCMREKYFVEMDDTQRIQKLSDELLRTQRKVEELCLIIECLLHHDHIDSKIMVEFKNPNEVNDRSIYFRPYDFKRKD